MVISAMTYSGSMTKVSIMSIPDSCPICKKSCTPLIVTAYADPRPFHDLQVVFRCPSQSCHSLFVARYRVTSSSVSESSYCTLISTRVLQFTITREFNDSISSLSPDFIKIFKEAEIAEGNELLLICGVGYRKSLEFLIKDYLIKNVFRDKPEEQKVVSESFLGQCISRYIEDPRIKETAERAVWLGNDETHYIRVWTDKDLKDLKRLISMTVNWIELVLDYEDYKLSMPKS